MSDKAAILRQLKIKTGVAKRLFKEHRSYVLEEEQQKIKLDKFIADNAEDWDIKNARRMLEESHKMIDDTAKRLGDAVQDLRQLLVAAEKDPSLTDEEDVLKAKEVLEEVSV
ncbi:tubulin binding cofactor A [Phanerochaete sordida]|uniref:Tubulin-specific chaperone A n=1 Tax=Phanerochaete sordida TaxID=48140 RepID=A0A9P3FZS4_9APHY|nr:tubulin binding cofactor A [Phanerochaete sordida]